MRRQRVPPGNAARHPAGLVGHGKWLLWMQRHRGPRPVGSPHFTTLMPRNRIRHQCQCWVYPLMADTATFALKAGL